MKKELLVCLLLLIGVAACRNNDNDTRFKALDEGLKEYGRAIKGNSDRVDNELKQKLHDFRTTGKAEIWQPKAAFIRAAADSMNGYLEALRNNLKKEAGFTTEDDKEITGENNQDAVNTLFEKQGKADTLYQKLIDFNEKVLSVLNPAEFEDNPVHKEGITKSKAEFREKFPIKKKTAITAYFKNAGTTAALVMLDKLQNDVAVTVSNLLDYCNNEVYSGGDLFEVFHVLVSQNSTYFKPGQTLEINAGLGAFSGASVPKITIDGKKIALNPGGIAEYKIKTAGKPGKYFIPVKINFIKSDGSEANYSKNIEYTVEQ